MWYQDPLKKIYSEFRSDPVRGLDMSEVARREKQYGLNVLPKTASSKWWHYLLAQFKSPLVYILVIGAVLTAILHEWVDTAVIVLAVLVNVAVGFWQEFRSNGILAKLNAVVETRALVIREGAVRDVDAKNIVPGDVIIIKPGMKVPADARIISAKRLEIDEAVLTGESSPAAKNEEEINENVSVGDRTNMVHMGTIVARGEGRAFVVGTGGNTELGTIARLTQNATDEPTPLQHRMEWLGRFIAILIGVIAFIIFAVGLAEGRPLAEMFTVSIAVAIAAIPEGLPAAISIILAVSAQRILRKKGVVKRLVAAETLGSASVICCDKTGTLTEGTMRVEKVIAGGFEDHGRIILALANEALVEPGKNAGEFSVKGEVTDKAKMQAFLENGGVLSDLDHHLPRIGFLPFDPANKYIASLHSASDGTEQKLFLSGAPEVLLYHCVSFLEDHETQTLTEERTESLREEIERYASDGYRVIAMAERTVPNTFFEGKVDLEEKDVREEYMSDLVFVGFAILRDPLRDDVRDSIRLAHQAGIKTVMLTGDHVLTAKAIGRELGFVSDGEKTMEGVEMEDLNDLTLAERIENVSIFARVTPEHKLKIVAAFQARGEVVAMTGDGVNDAPALKTSDIGVAVNSGTDIAKAASDLVLLNNSFSVIVAAVRQGRIAFDNIRKVTVFLLAGSFTEIILVVVALILKIPLPITAVQMLWTNLVEDSLPNVALSFEPGEKDIMDRPPLKKNEPVLDLESKTIIFIVGIFTDLVLLGVFLLLYYYSTLPIEHIRTIIFAGLGLDTFFYVYSIKSLREPIWSYNIFSNRYLVGATFIGVLVIFAAIYIPIFNRLLETVPLGLKDWTIILAIGVVEILGVEIAKWIFFGRKKKILTPSA